MTTERIGSTLKELLNKSFKTTVVPEDAYTKMHWPKLIPLMRFSTERLFVRSFGHAAFIYTKVFGVHMLTCTLTPNAGATVPFLMVEIMEIKGKCTAQVEYYDCTSNGVDTTAFEAAAEKYSSLEDYPEKPAWYIDERAKGSVSKIVLGDDTERLVSMVADCMKVYLKSAATAAKDPSNISGLKAFCERMIIEGNPLSDTFNKVLGVEEGKKFYRKVVLPVKEG